ncbi:MAG: HesA/MoeB/ThiF family protein, partial [Pseudomonadota bacterium]
MSLSPARLDRFARHIVLPEIGGAGQVALAGKHIAVIGLGGIGSPALQYLAGAGIGRFTLVDNDVVDASNLQRQTIFTSRDVGHGKATSARRWLANFDDALEVNISDSRITSENVGDLIAGADLVLDGTDNFATRLAVSDACVAERVSLLSAAVGRFQGQVGAFAGHLVGQPCY